MLKFFSEGFQLKSLSNGQILNLSSIAKLLIEKNGFKKQLVN